MGEAEAIPINTNYADYVFAFDSIDHWNDIDKGLSEIQRILKPDGIFVVVKDQSVPGAKEALKSLSKMLEDSGFVFSEQKDISAEGISFSLWLCMNS